MTPGGRTLRLGAVLGLLAASSAVQLAASPPAGAACQQRPAGGAALPATAGRDPVIARLGLDRSWDISTGAQETVAVVDSGVDSRQAKIAPALTGGLDFTPVDTKAVFQQTPGGTEDCENHGTPIAGLIAARVGKDDRVVGVAPDAKIAPIRIAVPIEQAPDTMIAAAIRAGAQRGSVLNLSFALPVDRPTIRQAVQFALSHNVVVVAAAGNENTSQPGQKWYPAAYPGVLAVAAVDDTGAPMQESNTGPWVGIAAPGENLTAPSAVKGFVAVSGTSFATGLVSGVAALVRSHFPLLPAKDVVKRLKETAAPVEGSPDQRVGAGIVDPFAALTDRDVDATGAASGPRPASTDSSVSVVPLPEKERSFADRWGRPLGWSGIVAVVAVLAFLARFAVRAASRRGWRAGGDPETGEPLAPPAPQPPDVHLV